MSRKAWIGAAAAGLALAAQDAARAQDGWNVSFVGATEYISKGAGKSDGPHGALTVERAFGRAYAGGWIGKVSTSKGADAEAHLYAGVKPTLAGVNFDLRAYYKTLPGTVPGVQQDLFEARVDASRSFGPTRLRLRAEYSPDSYASVGQAWWFEAEARQKLSERLSLVGAVGRREQDGGASYTAWNAGLRAAVSKTLDLDVRWYDTDARGLGDAYNGRVVAAVTARF